MSKKFIFLSGLFFFIPCFGMEVGQKTKASFTDILKTINIKKLKELADSRPGLICKVLRDAQIKDKKKILFRLKRAFYTSQSQERSRFGSKLRYKPYPKYRKIKGIVGKSELY